jgi:hypothetical protein
MKKCKHNVLIVHAPLTQGPSNGYSWIACGPAPPAKAGGLLEDARVRKGRPAFTTLSPGATLRPSESVSSSPGVYMHGASRARRLPAVPDGRYLSRAESL